MGRIVRGTGRVIPGAVLDARAQAAAIREDARREGYAAGLAEAAAALVAARAEAQRLVEAARPAALAVAARMAEKIVGRAVALDPSVMADIAGEALAASAPRDGVVRLRAHPDDIAALAPRRQALLARLGASAGSGAAVLELEPDDTVGRAGCIVETAAGRVDARLEVQIAALERALAAGRGERG
jgi:flagellar biosynthesis/type III secretory pathway protein FliH